MKIVILIKIYINIAYNVLVETGWLLGGGDAGEDGAVLDVEEVLLEDVLGVVVVELPELTVELESEFGKPCVVWLTCLWATGWFKWTLAMFLEWSVGIRGVLSSDVGVGGANLDGPGWVLLIKQNWISNWS